MNKLIKSQDKYDDSRFHPTVIGVILLVFILLVAVFIMKMDKYEEHSYFSAIYGAFITYSTIGFGDIDIYVIAF